MFKKQLAAILAAAVIVTPVLAEEEAHGASAAAHSETYVAVSVTRLTETPSSNGYAINIGHRYGEHCAAEIGYADSGALSNSAEKTTALSVAILGILPFTAEFEGFVRVGYASAHTKDELGASANRGDITYGYGVEYRLTEKYAVGLGYDQVRIGNDVEIPRMNENAYMLTVKRTF